MVVAECMVQYGVVVIISVGKVVIITIIIIMYIVIAIIVITICTFVIIFTGRKAIVASSSLRLPVLFIGVCKHILHNKHAKSTYVCNPAAVTAWILSYLRYPSACLLQETEKVLRDGEPKRCCAANRNKQDGRD